MHGGLCWRGKKYIRGVFYLHELFPEKGEALLCQLDKGPQGDSFGQEAFPPIEQIHPDEAERSTVIHLRVGIKYGIRGVSFLKGFDQGDLAFQRDLGVGD